MSELFRLFVGIFPSQSTQARLNREAEKWCKNLQTEVRVLKPESLHLTIKFIGNVELTRLDNFTTAFLKATGNLSPTSLQLKQLKLFPSHRKPRVVAAEINPSLELQSIFQFFNEGFSSLGIIVDRRKFHPHITVARTRHWQKETISPTPIQIVEPIESIDLIHSQLTPEGAKYSIVASIPLN